VRDKQKFIERFIQYAGIGYVKYRANDGVIVRADEGFLKILESDLHPEDLEGKSLSELMIYNGNEDEMRNKLYQMKELWNYEYFFKTINGKTKYVKRYCRLLKEKYYGKVLIESVLQDITENKISSEKMKESQKRYEKLFRNSGDVVSICSVDNMTIQEINPVTEIMTGYNTRELVGHPLERFLHPYSRKKIEQIKQDLLFVGSSKVEAVFVCADGKYKDVFITASLVELDAEDIALLIIKDISDIVKRREEQNKRNRELEDFYKISIEREERLRELTAEIKKLERNLADFKG
jgi:PAS domain S-box-containing protein